MSPGACVEPCRAQVARVFSFGTALTLASCFDFLSFLSLFSVQLLHALTMEQGAAYVGYVFVYVCRHIDSGPFFSLLDSSKENVELLKLLLKCLFLSLHTMFNCFVPFFLLWGISSSLPVALV